MTSFAIKFLGWASVAAAAVLSIAAAAVRTAADFGAAWGCLAAAALFLALAAILGLTLLAMSARRQRRAASMPPDLIDTAIALLTAPEGVRMMVPTVKTLLRNPPIVIIGAVAAAILIDRFGDPDEDAA